MKHWICALLLCCAFVSKAHPFGPGGIAVDWTQYDPKEKALPTQVNLMKNGSFEMPGTVLNGWAGKQHWVGWAHVHAGTTDPKIKALREKFSKAVSRSVSDKYASDGKYSAFLCSPESFKNAANPLPMLSNKIKQTVPVEQGKGSGRYRFVFSLRGRHAVTMPHAGALVVQLQGEKRGPKGKFVAAGKVAQSNFLLRPEWVRKQCDIILPPDATAVSVTISLYGLGEAWIDDCRLFPAEAGQSAADRVQVRLSPYELLDNTWCIGEGLPGVMNFAFHAENKKFPRKAQKLELTLPPGFTAVDCRDVCTLSGGQNNVWHLDLMRLGRGAFQDWYMLQSASVMVTSSLKSSEKLYTGSYRLVDGDWKGRLHEFKLKVIPAFQGVRPKMFRSAAMLGHEFTFAGAGREKIAEFYLKSGFSCIHGAKADLAARMQQAGLLRYTAHYFLCNGFRLGAAPKPESVQFKMLDGKPFPRKICPVEVYTRGPYYMKEVYEKILKKNIVGDDVTDFFMPNWEPYYLDSKGCFCDRCRDEFIKYSKGKPSKEEIMAVWPAGLLREYGDEYFKFRSWQHGRLVVTIHKDAAALGRGKGKESGFVPEISWRSVTYEGNAYCRQYNVKDYMYELPWLEPWGPYVFNRAGQPYNYYPAVHLSTYVAAGMMKRFILDSFKGRKAPGMIAFPHGFQGNDWVTEPEALAFEMLCFFVRGWEGVFCYYFPRGYDYRHWRAMAEANTTVARYEEFTFKGKNDNSGVKLTGLTPLPEKLYYAPGVEEPEDGVGRFPGLSKMGPIQFQTWRYRDEILVCAGNFWQKGEHFFKLQIAGLEAGRKYGVTVSGTNCGNFTGPELARGIILQVGALRWQFIRIGKPAAGPAGFSQADMKKLMARRLPEIRKLVAWEKARYAKLQSGALAENPPVDYAALKAVSSAGITVTPAKNNLTVKTPAYTLTVEPGQGGRIHEWRSAGTELITSRKMFGFAVAGFWYPPKSALQLRSPMKLEGIVPVKGGVEVRLSRVLTAKDSPKFGGLKFEITHLFTGSGVVTRTKITNLLHDAAEFAFRYHNMPALLGKQQGENGSIRFASGETFRRDFDQKLITVGKADPVLESAFKIVQRVCKAGKLPAVLSSPKCGTALELAFPVTPHSVVVWDDVRQDVPTFEPVFPRTQLDPGKSVEFVMQATLKKK